MLLNFRFIKESETKIFLKDHATLKTGVIAALKFSFAIIGIH